MEKDNALVLKYPVKIGTLPEVKVLNFRRIKGKDLKSFDMTNPNLTQILELAEKLTDQTTAFFEEMDGEDVIRVTDKVGKLLDSSQ